MSFKSTYILFGVLGAILLVFALILFFGPSEVSDETLILPSAHDAAVGEVKSADIDRVVIESTDGEKLVFVRQGEGDNKVWQMKEPLVSDVDRWVVEDMVTQILDARKVNADVNNNLKEWGLSTPRRVVTLEGKGRTFEVRLGDRSPGDASSAVVYVTTSDRKKEVMAVPLARVENAYTGNLDDFRTRDLLANREADIGYLKLARNKGEAIVLENTSGTRWTFTQPTLGPADFEGDAAANADNNRPPTGVRALLTALINIKVDGKPPVPGDKTKTKDTGFVSNNADDKALETYGLKSAETADLVLTIKKDPGSKSEKTLLVGNKVDDKGEQRFARLADTKQVVKIPAVSLETLRKFLDNPSEVRDHNLVRLSDPVDVVRLRYHNGSEIELVKTPSRDGLGAGKWTLYEGKERKGQTTDSVAVDTFVNTLLQPRQVKSFPANKTDSELGLDKPSVVVSLWANGIKKETPKDDKKEDKKDDKKPEGDRPTLRSETPDVQLDFSSELDVERRVAVKRKSGPELKEATLVKVQGELLELARKDPLSYLERSLKEFYPVLTGPRAVHKLSRELEGAVVEVVRKDPAKPDEGWEFKRPDSLVGRKADANLVQVLLSKLNALRVERWVTLKADDLSTWGLKTPTGKVTLGLKLDGKDSDVSLLIGKSTDDGKGFYAKRSDLDPVFVVNKNEVDQLKDSLLDQTVLEFNPAEVKTIKVTNIPLPGLNYVVELERKSPTEWTVKAPPDLKVNAPVLSDMIRTLARVRAEKFVVLKTGPKPEHKLELKDGAVQIELVLDNKNKDTFTLTLGAKEGDAYYATCNTVKGDVVLIGKGNALFDTFKKGGQALVGQ